MNIKSLKLRITNKRLKSELKKCKHRILYEDAHIKLVSSLEDDIENEQNENEHLKKLNEEYFFKYYTLSQEDAGLEKDLSICKRKLIEAEGIVADYKVLNKNYKENVHRLSIDIAALTKKNEGLKSNGIASKLKNILKRGKQNGRQHI